MTDKSQQKLCFQLIQFDEQQLLNMHTIKYNN
jgi:hypothetical protein